MFFGRPLRQASLESPNSKPVASPSQQLKQARNTQPELGSSSSSSLASLRSGPLTAPSGSSQTRTLAGRTRDNFELRYELAADGQQADSFESNVDNDISPHQDQARSSPMSFSKCRPGQAEVPGAASGCQRVKSRELSYADDGIR